MARLSRRAMFRVACGAMLAGGVATSVAGAVAGADEPFVDRIGVSQTSLARGNRFTVRASIIGGFRTAAITYAVPGGGRMTQFLRLTFGNNYETTFAVAANAPVGEYRVESIVLRDDRNAVMKYISPDDPAVAPLFAATTVRVSTDGNPGEIVAVPPLGQPIPPVAPAVGIAPIATAATMEAVQFVAVRASQTLLAYGNSFTLHAVMRGPVSTARVTYAYPGGDITRSLAFIYASGDEGHYEATIRVSGDLPPGRYVVTRLTAEGTNGSFVDFNPAADDPIVVGSGVDVYGSPPPLIPSPSAAAASMAPMVAAFTSPISFAAVTVSAQTVRPGESFTVTATINDTMGSVVGQPVVSFSDGQRELFAFFARGSDGLYRATVPVSQYYPDGTFLLTRLYAYDDRGNTVNLRSPNTSAFRADVTVRR